MTTIEDLVPAEAEYYLHSEGNLLYKPHGGVQHDSPFVVRVWSARHIVASPEAYLSFLLEAKRLGANASELKRLHDLNRLSEYIPDAGQQLGLL